MSGQGVNRAPTQSLFPEFMDPTFLVDEVNLNRNFIGIELDPTYFEIAKQRCGKLPLEPNHTGV